MKVARFKVMTAFGLILIVCSTLVLFIPLGNAWVSRKDRDIIHIPIGHTIYGLSTPAKQYFKYAVRQWMDVSVTMWPSPDADYDLYGKWVPDTLPQGTLAGDPINDTDFGLDFGGVGVPESAGSTLGPGTYYIMVHNYSGTGTYDLSVWGVSVKLHPPQRYSRWFNDTRRITAMYYSFSPRWFVTPDEVFSVPEDRLGHQPVVFCRNNKVLECYENDELKLTLFFLGTKKRTFCLAHLNDKSAGNNYLLVALRNN